MPPDLLKALEAYARRFKLRPVQDVLDRKPLPQPWWAK